MTEAEKERAAIVNPANLATWAERRPPRTEDDRYLIAKHYSERANLPETPQGVFLSDDDMNAMKAAFICRFDEDLPRTETLMAVANIGYRRALLDHHKGEGREG